MARTVAIFHPQPVDAQKALIPIRTAVGDKTDAIAARDVKCDSQVPSAAAIVNFLRERPNAIVAQPANDDSSAPRYLTADIGADFDSGAFVRGIFRLFNEPLWTLRHWDCTRLYVVEEHAAAFREMVGGWPADSSTPPKCAKTTKAGRPQSAREQAKAAILALYPNGIPDVEKEAVVVLQVNEHLERPVSRETIRRARQDLSNARA